MALILLDKNYDTPYGIPVSLPILEGQDSGDSSFDLSKLFIKTSEGNVTALTIDEGTLSISLDGKLDWFSAESFEGTVPPIVIVAYNANDDFGEFSVNITVEPEPELPVTPIEALDSPKWWLGSFRTGNLEGFEIPYINDSVSLDIYGDDEAEITVPMMALSDIDRLNFNKKFEINEKFIALFDEGEKVVFAGYIEKLSPNLVDETLAIKAKGFKSWLKTRFVVNSDKNSIDKSTDTWKIVASPRTVAKTVVQAALMGNNNPSSVKYPPSRSGSYKAEYVLSELTTISDALDAISMDRLGVEVKFVPKKVSNKIVWELVAGKPHINDHGLANIVLNLEDPNMIAVGFDKIIDGVDAYNRLWLESPYEDQKDDEINLKARLASGSKLIRETKEKFDVEMTDSELQEQFDARFEDANKTNNQNSVSIFDDDYSFYGSVGRRLQLLGSDKSAGLDEIVRIVGVSFSTTERTIELTVDNIKRVYPMLPKNSSDKNKKDTKKEIKKELKWNSKVGAGGGSSSGSGGGNPWNPGEGTGGDPTNKDLWGSEGQPADGSAPTVIENGIITDVFSETQLFTPNDDGPSILESVGSGQLGVPYCQNEGNRVFILTKTGSGLPNSVNIPVGEQKETPMQLGVPTNVVSLIDDQTLGEIWVRKTFVQAGNIGNIDFAGKIDNNVMRTKLMGANVNLVKTSTNASYSASNLRAYPTMSRIEMTPFVSNGRLFIHLNLKLLIKFKVTLTHISNGTVSESTLPDEYVKSIVLFASTQINQDGTLNNVWVDSEPPPNGERVQWESSYRYGSIFGYGSSLPIGETINSAIFAVDQTQRIRGILGQWYSIPVIKNSSSGQTNFAIRSVSYNMHLYSMGARTYGSAEKGINKIRVHVDGTTPTESWEKILDDETTSNGIGMAVCRGYLIYQTNTGIYYARILPSGSIETPVKSTVGSISSINISYGGYIAHLSFNTNQVTVRSFRIGPSLAV